MGGIKKPIYVNPEFINKYGLPKTNGEDVKYPIATTLSSTSWVPESYVAMNTPTTTPEMDAIIKAYTSGVPATTPTTTTNNITASNVVNVPTTAVSEEEKTSSNVVTGDGKSSDTPFTLGDSPKTEEIEAVYGNTVTAIDNNLARTEADIEKQRQEAIRNAYSGYDKSLSTYGRNAEQLAAMGLGNSGYSDYLTGVAYGNMVGGVQSANEGADEAIRNAYADADQLKLNAEAKKNADIAAAQEKHRDNMISLLTGVGTVDSSVAEAIARSYGFSDDEVNYIKSTYGEYEKAEAVNQLDFYAKHGYLVDANGNQYVPTESEIEKLGVKAAYGTEQIGEVKDAVETQNYDAYKTQVTADMDDATIDAITDLDDKAKSDLKAYRDDLKADQKIAQIESEEAGMGDITDFDKLKENGEISTDAYQKAYFAKALSWIEGIDKPKEVEEGIAELDRLLHWGKISQKDYDNLKQYLYDSAVTAIDNGKVSVTEGLNGTFNLTFDGKTYVIEALNEPSEKRTKDALENVSGDIQFVTLNDVMYIKTADGWRMATASAYETATPKNIQKAFKEYADSYGKKLTTPTHQQ